MQNVYYAHLIDGDFGEYHKLHLYGAHFIGTKEIARFNPYNEAFFTIIGYLPEWKDAYRGSSAGRPPYCQETFDGFAAIMRRQFTNDLENPSPYQKPTTETVEEINRILSGS